MVTREGIKNILEEDIYRKIEIKENNEDKKSKKGTFYISEENKLEIKKKLLNFYFEEDTEYRHSNSELSEWIIDKYHKSNNSDDTEEIEEKISTIIESLYSIVNKIKEDIKKNIKEFEDIKKLNEDIKKLKSRYEKKNSNLKDNDGSTEDNYEVEKLIGNINLVEKFYNNYFDKYYKIEKISSTKEENTKYEKLIEKIEKIIDHIKLERKRLNYFDIKYKKFNENLEQKSKELQNGIEKAEKNNEKNKFDVIALSTLVFTAFTIVSTNVGVYSKVIEDINKIPMSRIALMMIVTNIIIISAIHIVYSMIRLMAGKMDDKTFNSIISNYFVAGFFIILFIILIIPFFENVLIPLFKNNILPFIKNIFIKITTSNKTAYLLPLFKLKI